jgi:hypothetical protein
VHHILELALDLPDRWTWGAWPLDAGGWGVGLGGVTLVVRILGRTEPDLLRLGHIRNCELCGARLCRLPAIACCDYACPDCGMHWIAESEWLDPIRAISHSQPKPISPE